MAGLFRLNPLGDAAQAIPLLQRAEADLSRRRMLKLLGLTAGSATLLAAASVPVWRADFATATGETRRFELPGDVEVLLNTGSAIDIHGQKLSLRSGEALVEGEQWQLRCAFAECVGHRARMSVREYDNRSEIRVEQGEVQVRVAAGQHQLQAGEGLAVSAMLANSGSGTRRNSLASNAARYSAAAWCGHSSATWLCKGLRGVGKGITTDSDLAMRYLQNGSRHDNSQQPRAEPLGKRGIVHFPYAPRTI